METPIYQGEPHGDWQETDKLARAKRMIVSTLLMSAEHYRPLKANFDDYFDRYTGQPLKLRQTNRIRSNVPSGMMSEMIDTYRSDLMTKILKKRPLVAAIPLETSDIEIAAVRETLIQFQVDNATPDMGMWPVADQAIFNILVFGLAPIKNVMVARTRNMRVSGLEDMQATISYRGPIPLARFIHDVFLHPNKVWAEDPYGIVDASFESYDKLLELNRRDVYMDSVKDIPDMKDMKHPEFLGGDAESILAAFGDLYERSEQRARLGWTDDNRLEQDGVLTLECECMFRHKLGEDPVRSILTMANGVIIGVSETPMPSGGSVWNLSKGNHLPGQAYGISMIEKSKPQAHIAEVTINMVLQNLAQSVNKQKVLRRDLLESATSLDDQPGGVFMAKPNADLSQVMREIQVSPVGQDAFRVIQLAQDLFQGSSGAQDLKTGRVMKGETTATEQNLAFSQASQRFRWVLEWIGSSWILPMVRKWDEYNQVYLDLPFIHRVLGSSAQSFNKVEEQHFMIPVDYVLAGPTRDEDDALRIAQLQNALKISTPYLQFIEGMDVPIKKSLLHVLSLLNVPDIEQITKVLNPNETTPLLPPPGQGGGMDQSINRQDRRLGSGDVPTGGSSLAKSLGGILANVGR
jgi:hypothetical protein